MNITAICNWQI